jgi:hypothetical protein
MTGGTAMVAVKVKDYWAGWDVDGHFGTLNIRTEDFHVPLLTISDPAEFSAVVDILRNEQPLLWDSATKKLSTYNETPGEAET